MHKPDRDGDSNGDAEGGPQRHLDFSQQPRQAHSDQADDGPNGEIDAAGDDHKRDPDAQDPEQRGSAKQVLNVVGGKKLWAHQVCGHAHHQQQSKNTQ
jgi:hypothetical protein